MAGPKPSPHSVSHKIGGLPDNLRSGIETLSGIDLSDVRVHYNSHAPTAIMAHAFTQGSDIHLGPGQERHLSHEAWHVVQQKQGRVRPTIEAQGSADNNNDQARVMGTRSLVVGEQTNDP